MNNWYEQERVKQLAWLEAWGTNWDPISLAGIRNQVIRRESTIRFWGKNSRYMQENLDQWYSIT